MYVLICPPTGVLLEFITKLYYAILYCCGRAAKARSRTWGLVLSTSGVVQSRFCSLEAVLDGARRAFKAYCSKGLARAFLSARSWLTDPYFGVANSGYLWRRRQDRVAPRFDASVRLCDARIRKNRGAPEMSEIALSLDQCV